LSDNSDLAGLLKGAAKIAEYTGETYRQTVYKLSTKQIPGWKVGSVWYSTKPKIAHAFSATMPPITEALRDERT
jgi:hypothetical protein